MRETQVIGLSDKAQQLILGEPQVVYVEETIRYYPDGSWEKLPPRPVTKPSVTRVKSGKFFSGIGDELHLLYKYILPDGRVLEEKVQAEPWSSGPCFFLALVDENGSWVPESLWSQEDIDAA